MENMYGYALPMRHQNRGFRAVENFVKSGCVLHDASYLNRVAVVCSIDELCTLLSPFVDGETLEEVYNLPCKENEGQHRQSEKKKKNQIDAIHAHGPIGLPVAEFTTLMHGKDAFPSHCIGPMRIMIHFPSSSNKVELNEETGEQEEVPVFEFWLWIHPAISDQIEKLLKTEAESINCRTSSENICESPIKVFQLPKSGEGSVALFSIRGAFSSSCLLQACMSCPSSSSSSFSNEQDGTTRRESSGAGADSSGSIDEKKTRYSFMCSLLETMHKNPKKVLRDGYALEMNLSDPRQAALFNNTMTMTTKKKVAFKREAQLAACETRTSNAKRMQDTGAAGTAAFCWPPGLPPSYAADSTCPFFSALWELCGASSGRSSVVSSKHFFNKDHVINERKHKERQDAFSAAFMNRSGSSSSDRATDASSELEVSTIPILFIRRESEAVKYKMQPKRLSGWDIIIPQQWATVVWHALVFSGCDVIGVEEFDHACRDSGISSFPRDFPDSAAGKEYWQQRGEKDLALQMKRPPAKRHCVPTLASLLQAVQQIHERSRRPSPSPVVGEESDDKDEEQGASFVVVRGEHFIHAFRPPTASTWEGATSFPIRPKIDLFAPSCPSTTEGNSLQHTRTVPVPEMISGGDSKEYFVERLPPLPQLTLLRVSIVPTARGCPHDLAEVLLPLPADYARWCGQRSARRVRLLQQKALKAHESTLARQRNQRRKEAQEAHYNSKADKKKGNAISENRSTSSSLQYADQLEKEKQLSTQLLDEDKLSVLKEAAWANTLAAGSGVDALSEWQGVNIDELMSHEEAGELRNLSKEVSERKIRTEYGGRTVIGFVTSGQKKNMNNTGPVLALCSAAELNGAFAAHFGQHETEPHAHLLVLYRNPLSGWLRPALVEIL